MLHPYSCYNFIEQLTVLFEGTDQLMPSVWPTHRAEIDVRVKGILYDKNKPQATNCKGSLHLINRSAWKQTPVCFIWLQQCFSPRTSKAFYSFIHSFVYYFYCPTSSPMTTTKLFFPWDCFCYVLFILFCLLDFY